MNAVINSFLAMCRERRGVTSLEYALLSVVITIAVYPWLYIIGAEVETPFLVVYDTLAHIRPF